MKRMSGFLLILLLAACSSKKRIAPEASDPVQKLIDQKTGGETGATVGADGGSELQIDGRVALFSAQQAKEKGLDLENLSTDIVLQEDSRLNIGERENLKIRVLGSAEINREETVSRRIDEFGKGKLVLRETRTLKSESRSAVYSTTSKCEMNKREKSYSCRNTADLAEGDAELFKQRDSDPCEFIVEKDSEPLFTIAGAKFETAQTHKVFEKAILTRSIESGTLACKGQKPLLVVRERLTIESGEAPELTNPLVSTRKLLASVVAIRDEDSEKLISGRIVELQ